MRKYIHYRVPSTPPKTLIEPEVRMLILERPHASHALQKLFILALLVPMP